METPSLYIDSPALFWNAVALECNRLDHTGAAAPRNQRGPTLSSRALAITHIAMHDAYVIVRAGLGAPVPGDDAYLQPPQRPPFSAPAGSVATQVAAAALAAAAATALLHLYPAQAALVNAHFDAFCARWGASDAGHRYGRAVAGAVIDLRRDDGADPVRAIPDHTESPARGRHREDPLNRSQSFVGPRYGFVRPFAISSFHPLAPPPALGSPAYAADLAEVTAKGAAPGSAGLTRTPDETVQGLYWAYDGPEQIGTPPRLYNQVLREIVRARALPHEQTLRLLFLANVAMGDAGVLAWFYKYHYDLWRPVVGVREHDGGMGPGATSGSNPLAAGCDPFWRPLGAPRTNTLAAPVPSFTPPFPAYPSGHATFGAAAFGVARLYLAALGQAQIGPDGRDNIGFAMVSDELDGRSVDPDGTVRTRHLRRFSGLHQAIYENSVSRVFLGVHWRFDGTTGQDAVAMLAQAPGNVGGVPLGLAIARDIVGQANIRPSDPGVQAPGFDATP